MVPLEVLKCWAPTLPDQLICVVYVDLLINRTVFFFNQTTEKAIIRKEKHLNDETCEGDDEEVIYKIEVAANRYIERKCCPIVLL